MNNNNKENTLVTDKAFLDKLCSTCNAMICSKEDRACREEWCDYIQDANVVFKHKNDQFKEILEETKEEFRPKEPFEEGELEMFEAIELFVVSVRHKLNKLNKSKDGYKGA